MICMMFWRGFAVLLHFQAAMANPAETWIHITKDQATQAAVVKLKEPQRLQLETCREAAFESTGSDFISESQFTLIVLAVVDRAGQIQRFRIAMGPPAPVDLAKPIQRALEAWRYKVPTSGEAFEIAIVLRKAMGAAQTSACSRVSPKA